MKEIQNPEFNLYWLISPTPDAVFMSQYWEKRPLYINRSSDYYDTLLNAAGVDSILTTFSHIPLSIIKDGKMVPAAYYASGKDKEKVFEFYTEGGTIIIDKVEENVSSLRRLCEKFKDFFGVSNMVYCNLYFTPPGKQAFELHADDQDVFILQIDGSKKWTVYAPEFELPITHKQAQLAEGFEQRNMPLHELELKRGDILYVPRGFPHRVMTTEHHSIHITLTVINYTSADLVNEAMKELTRRNVELRKSLRRDFQERNMDSYTKLLSDELTDDVWRVAKERLSESIASKYKADFKNAFVDLLALSSITENTYFRKRPGLKLEMKDIEGTIHVKSNAGEFSIPDVAKEVTFIIATDNFCAAELPGELEVTDKVELTRLFVQAGMLTLLDTEK